MSITHYYDVTYRLTEAPKPSRGACVRRGGPRQIADGLWRSSVAVTDGYSTVESIPRIIAIAHPVGRVDPGTVEILRTEHVADICGCGRRIGWDGHPYRECDRA